MPLAPDQGARTLRMIGTDWEKGFIAQTSLGRTGKPDDIADVVVFLASNESRWLTAENLVGSGGLH